MNARDALAEHLPFVENALWPLFSRAADALSPRPVLADTISAELARRIPYDFSRLGKPSLWLAVREKKLDLVIEEFFANGRPGTVLSLGVGFETRAMRLSLPGVMWTGVDLPPVTRMRGILFGRDERYRLISGSVMDVDWRALDVDPDRVIITAAGLLMYLAANDVRHLLQSLAGAFRGAQLVFDTIHPRYSALSMMGLARVGALELPPMPWGISISNIRGMEEWAPVEVLEVEDFARGYRSRFGVTGFAAGVPILRDVVADALVRVRLG